MGGWGVKCKGRGGLEEGERGRGLERERGREERSVVYKEVYTLKSGQCAYV